MRDPAQFFENHVAKQVLKCYLPKGLGFFTAWQACAACKSIKNEGCAFAFRGLAYLSMPNKIFTFPRGDLRRRPASFSGHPKAVGSWLERAPRAWCTCGRPSCLPSSDWNEGWLVLSGPWRELFVSKLGPMNYSNPAKVWVLKCQWVFPKRTFSGSWMVSLRSWSCKMYFHIFFTQYMFVLFDIRLSGLFNLLLLYANYITIYQTCLPGGCWDAGAFLSPSPKRDRWKEEGEQEGCWAWWNLPFVQSWP